MIKIINLDEFRSHIADKEEIREMDMKHGLKSFCYMVSAENTFDNDFARECRGIVFDGDRVVGRPLHKFFNVNEREETQVHNLDWSKVVRVMDKRDGSMIHTVIVGDQVLLKSKKSFDSDVAVMATKWVADRPNFQEFFHKIAQWNCTAIFEWTAPDARIVLHYPTAELRLLHVRENETGTYWEFDTLELAAGRYGIGLVDEPGVSGTKFNMLEMDHMLELAKTIEGIEGWVLQFENGDMVKLKTQWYLERHRAMTFLRERDIAEAVLNESLDDLKALLVGEGVDITEILKIESDVITEIRWLEAEVESIYERRKHLTRKDFAIEHNGHRLFGLLMSKFIGKEPDVKGFFEKNMLKDQFSLRQLVLVPSVAEAE